MDLIVTFIVAIKGPRGKKETCPNVSSPRNDDWYRIRTRWFLIRDQKVTEASFDTALYSGRELADLLKRAGFEQVKLFGSLQRIPYDLKAQRLVAVAQKRQA